MILFGKALVHFLRLGLVKDMVYEYIVVDLMLNHGYFRVIPGVGLGASFG